jgi:hypothetical protein
MHVVIRTYYGKGNRKLFAAGEQNEAELQSLMRSVAGLVSYTLARDRRGGFSVTICQDERGLKQSRQIARDFLKKHAPQISTAAMHIAKGTVITHVQ